MYKKRILIVSFSLLNICISTLCWDAQVCPNDTTEVYQAEYHETEIDQANDGQMTRDAESAMDEDSNTNIQTNITFQLTSRERKNALRARKKIDRALDGLQAPEQKPFAKMSYEQLCQVRDWHLYNGNLQTVTKALEQILKICTEADKRADHLIELADAYVARGEYAAAASQYTEFMLFYQGHEKMEYASYQGVLCEYNQIGSPDRDQTHTKLTLGYIDNYLANTRFAQYRQEVLQLRDDAQKILKESQKNICDFYIHDGKYVAAQSTIDRMREQWSSVDPFFEKDLLLLEIALLEKQADKALLDEKLLQLHTQFPDDMQQETFVLASNETTENSPLPMMKDRF